MSLFQFGFTRISNSSPGCSQDERVSSVPAHMPTQEDSGLGAVEYESAMNSVSDLCDPTTSKKRRQRGTYTHYTPSDRAKIGKYALENGNLRALRHFSAIFPDIKESTVRNFKKAYKEHIDHQRKQQNPKPVTEILSKHRGRPPLLLQIDAKLIVFLKAVRKRGGVINCNIVRATAKALIESAESGLVKESLSKIDLPRSWVQSIYRRMKLNRRMATTSRPPVPCSLYNECRTHFLRCVDKMIKKYTIPCTKL